MAKAKSTTADPIDILPVQHETITLYVLGRSPLVMNRMSEKAKHELLMPRGRKTAAEKSVLLKHDPLEEYRASVYRLREPDAPTRLALLATAFKGAMRTVALDIPGAKKAQIGRLTYVEGERVPIYGTPQIFMAVVRSADMNRTPDIRSRAILPTWACTVRVTFVHPLMRAQQVANLLAAAGLSIGVGDGRPEKGALAYGQFEIVNADDPRFLAVVASGGVAAQDAALLVPQRYDDETESMLDWFEAERRTRQMRGVA